MMDVLFVFDSGQGRIIAVIWEDDGKCRMRKLDSRTSFKDEDLDDVDSLRNAVLIYGGPYSPMYPARVNDLRSAFQYIGKSSDLVKLLPTAEV